MTVILVTLDGVRPDAIQQVNSPHMDTVMANGAYTLQARSVMPSVTLPCHMSIFHSVPPERHGILTNDYHPMVRPMPGLFEQIKHSGKRAGIVYSWEQLRDLGRPGSLIFSHYNDLDFKNLPESDHHTIDVALPLIENDSFDFLFVYIGSTDEIGHAHGWMSDEYLHQVEIADGQVGRLIAAMSSSDAILIEADHGGHDRNHGTDSPEDMTIPWMVMGQGIKSGVEIQQQVTLLDTAPTLATLLSVPVPPVWEGSVITEALVDSPDHTAIP